MRDLAVFAFLIAAIGVTLWRAWLGVLSLAVFSYLNPHAYAWGFMSSFPSYQVLVIIAFIMLLISKERQSLPSDWRVSAFYLLWLYFFVTTLNALAPWAAWPKLLEVSKIYLPFILTLILINTRTKLLYLIATIAASFGVVGMKGGIWAIGSGFSHRVYGPPNTQFYENNAFAIALLITIPLLILWRREVKVTWLWFTITASIPLCFAAALSSWSRGAILTIGVLGLVLIWHSRRKYLVLPLVALGVFLVSGALPEEWYDRMYSIEYYEEDGSAQSRLTTWTDGFYYAITHPLLGAGFEGWRVITRADWHSSYVEIMAEHGLVAFTIWLSLLFGSILSLTRLLALGRRHPELPWITNYATMLRASLIAYAAGTVFLGLSYWDIFYHLVFIAVLTKKFALAEIADLEAARVTDTDELASGNVGSKRRYPTFSP